jgi:hypothetical protein
VKLKDIPMPTLVAGAASVLWVGSFGLRAIKPDLAIGPAADTLMATVVAWWVKTRKDAQGGDDLLTEVATKFALPYISTAHADDEPKPAEPYTPKPAQPYSPKPAQPYTPKPTAPPKPGGMPWGP